MAGRALIVTDIQNGFTRIGNLASERMTALIPTIVRIAEEERAAGTPIIFTKDTHVENDKEFEVFPPHCIEGTEEHDLVEELLPFESDAEAVIEKHRYSAFFQTELDKVLERLAPDEVHIVGVCSDICVLHTTADLRNHDYPVVIRREGVETFDGPGHDADEMNRFALTHAETILGAKVV
ncbi:MAG TPA: isochorismatase family cysteine hydrolase [Actinomycetota bacterium]